MKKYATHYAFATNIVEFLTGAEPRLTDDDCRRLPIGEPVTEHVLTHKLKSLDAPFSVNCECDAVVLHIEQTASGPQLLYIDDINAVKAVQSELKAGTMHLSFTPDGTATRAILALPFCDEAYERVVGFIKAGGQKAKPNPEPAKPDPDDSNPFDDTVPSCGRAAFRRRP